MSKKQFFQTDELLCIRQAESQGSRTKPANRPCGDFQRPDPIVIDAKFRVYWSYGQSDGTRGVSRTNLDLLL